MALVTGVATAADGTQHSVFWLGGRIFDITPRAKGQNSEAFSFNQWGQASVQAEAAAKDPNNENFCAYGSGLKCLPFVWVYGAMIPLPTLGGNNGSVGNINNRGLMAGFAENSTRDPAVPARSFPLRHRTPGSRFRSRRLGARTWPGARAPPAARRHRRRRALDQRQRPGGRACRARAPTPCIPPLAFGPHAVLWDSDGTPVDLGNLGAAVVNIGSIDQQSRPGGWLFFPDPTEYALQRDSRLPVDQRDRHAGPGNAAR